MYFLKADINVGFFDCFNYYFIKRATKNPKHF